MELKLLRYSSGHESTLGILYIDGKPSAYTLEDEYRTQKVRGETRIAAGIYPVKFREDPSPKTMQYRERYDFFKWHLELQNVPDFNYVYIHVGNKDEHTDGCILVAGTSILNDDKRDGFIGNSVEYFRKVYMKVAAALDKGEKVTIQIIDYDQSLLI